MERIAVLGASRGLGFELSKILLNYDVSLLLSSRKIQDWDLGKSHSLLPADFTKSEDQDRILNALTEFQPHRLFYVAGGGPYGNFADKEWKDHVWAYQLNLLFPARLMFQLLKNGAQSDLKQMIFVGSSVAESKPDPKAASYSSAKHGLKGLVETLKLEYPKFDLRLFSPGYMDTDMLPANALPRQSEGLVAKSHEVAQTLWQWSNSQLN